MYTLTSGIYTADGKYVAACKSFFEGNVIAISLTSRYVLTQMLAGVHKDSRRWPIEYTAFGPDEGICGVEDVYVIKPRDANAEIDPDLTRPSTLVLCDALFRRPLLDSSSPPAQFREPMDTNDDELAGSNRRYAAGRLLYAFLHMSTPANYEDPDFLLRDKAKDKNNKEIIHSMLGTHPRAIAAIALLFDRIRYNGGRADGERGAPYDT